MAVDTALVSESCADEPGKVMPVVEANRCEGKEDCLRVCPYTVFEVRVITDAERAALTRFARFKVWAHGGKQAFVVQPQDCHDCRLCVAACPEDAITLAAFASG